MGDYVKITAPRNTPAKTPFHDDVIKWKHFPRYWPFVRGINRSGDFPAQRPVARSFYVFFDLRLNKRLSKQSWGWWFETLSRPLWRHRNVDRLQQDVFVDNYKCMSEQQRKAIFCVMRKVQNIGVLPSYVDLLNKRALFVFPKYSTEAQIQKWFMIFYINPSWLETTPTKFCYNEIYFVWNMIRNVLQGICVFVPKGPIINDNPALVQIMAWRQSGGKPLSEPMMVRLLTDAYMHYSASNELIMNIGLRFYSKVSFDAMMSVNYFSNDQYIYCPSCFFICIYNYHFNLFIVIWCSHVFFIAVLCQKWKELNWLINQSINTKYTLFGFGLSVVVVS